MLLFKDEIISQILKAWLFIISNQRKDFGPMEKMFFMIILFFTFLTVLSIAQESAEIRLLVRGDDMGMTHSINEGCIKAYKEGIMRTVEVMVPCPWYPEAVKLLNENPGLEVGVHLVLTSEWENFKCRPLTNAPSLVDENGYFYPMVWPNKNFPDGTAFVNVKWKKEEVEKELRAQIDLALKNIPRINHLSPHMAVMKSSPELEKVFEKVAKEYNLKYEYSLGITRIKGLRDHNKTPVEKETALLKILEQLQPGSWMLLRHPALDTPEMRAISHKGYENVAADRIGDTFIFTSDKVKKIIKKRGIKLITYQDLLHDSN